MVAAAVQDTRAAPVYATAVGAAGAVGTASAVLDVAGVMADDADEAAESPTTLLATTEKVTAEPFASPVTAHAVDPEVVQVAPDDEVTRYPVMELPPEEGADHDTTAAPLYAVATTPVGFPGTEGLA